MTTIRDDLIRLIDARTGRDDAVDLVDEILSMVQSHARAGLPQAQEPDIGKPAPRLQQEVWHDRLEFMAVETLAIALFDAAGGSDWFSAREADRRLWRGEARKIAEGKLKEVYE